MIRVWDLDKEVLASLPHEGIEKYIDLEIAHAGILPVEKPEVPSLQTAGIAATSIGFECGGVIVRTMDDAKVLSGLSLVKEQYDYTTGYSYKWLEPVTDTKITQVAFYEQVDVVRCKDVLTDLTRKKDQYEKTIRAYGEYLNRTGKIRNEVYAHVAEAVEQKRQIELAKKTYAKHLELAEGNADIARNFFVNAYKDKNEIIKEVIGEPEMAEAVEGVAV